MLRKYFCTDKRVNYFDFSRGEYVRWNNFLYDYNTDDYKMWEDYNRYDIPGTPLIWIAGMPIAITDYTRYFFDKWNLYTFLNTSCQKFFQLGVASGKFIEDYQIKAEWDVSGYDYSATAIEYLKKHNISAKQIDLNAIDQNATSLLYQQELSQDLATPINFLAVRILQYLEPKALSLLLFTVMNTIKPDSVLFLVTTVLPKNEDDVIKENRKQSITNSEGNVKERGFIFSFFAPRTDFAVLFRTTTDPVVVSDARHHYDEVIVLKKL